MKLLDVCVIILILGHGHHVQSTDIYPTTPLYWTEGDVRLLNGSVRSEGRVEVYWQSRWCVVCDDYWDLTDANVVCRQLGYPAASEVVLESGFGDGEGEIMLDDVICTGYESSLIECGSNDFFDDDCSRNDIAGVVCATDSSFPFDSLRIIDGPAFNSGRVELYVNGSWGTICDDYWNEKDANVICRQLGFYTAENLYSTAYSGVGSGPILRQLECDGNEMQWTDCSFYDWNTTECSHQQVVGVTCIYADEGDIRLTGGDGYRMGTVEIYHDFTWGTVCDNYWDNYDNHVVCRQLGLGAAVKYVSGAFFGQGQGKIVLDDVHCTGSEERLDQCKITDWYSEKCKSDHAVGVECSNPSLCRRPGLADSSVIYSPDSTVYQRGETVTFSCDVGYFLEGKTTAVCQLGSWDLEFNQTCQRDIRLLDGSVRSEGRVEVYWQSNWWVVCDDYWDLTDANVVCRQLGYPAASEVVPLSGFGDGEGEIMLDDVMCTGYESSLIECGSNDFFNHDCSRNEIAGVVCATDSSIPFDSLRIIDGPTFNSGRVELYFNGSWGTICDDYWNEKDANVICRQLGFYTAENFNSTAYFGVGSGPILRQLGCDGNEMQWANCLFYDWNTTSCSHQQDAGVTCIYAGEGDIRLTSGDGYSMGTVEIYHDFTWGTVCDHYWDKNDSNVVCRQLGFEVAVRFRSNAFFGHGHGQIVLDDVHCTGSEVRLDQCQIKDWYSNKCKKEHAVGVECSNPLRCRRPGLADLSVTYSPDSTEYQHSETVTFSCKDRYILEGKTTAVCQLGSWDSEFNQTCQPLPCRRPVLADSSVLYSPDSTAYQHNKTMTFSCKFGYFLEGETTAVCQLGSWDLEFNQTCQPLPCRRPGLADSSVIYSPDSTEYQHNKTMTFSCEFGYFLEGETTAVCQLGSWDSELNQKCQPSPCRRPDLADSSMIFSPDSTEYQHNKNVAFSCKFGYFLEGEKTAVCQFGSWDSEINQTCQHFVSSAWFTIICIGIVAILVGLFMFYMFRYFIPRNRVEIEKVILLLEDMQSKEPIPEKKLTEKTNSEKDVTNTD